MARKVFRFKDPDVELAFNDVYDTLEQKVGVDELDIPAVARAVALEMGDEQIVALNNLTEGVRQARTLSINQTRTSSSGLYVNKSSPSGDLVPTVVFYGDMEATSVLRVENSGDGSALKVVGRNGDSFPTIEIDSGGGSAPEILSTSGASLSAGGDWTDGSSIAGKEILFETCKVDLPNGKALPIYFWKRPGIAAKHVGPVAEEFHESTDLGDDKTIRPGDLGGLALRLVSDLQLTVKDLTTRVRELEIQLQEKP